MAKDKAEQKPDTPPTPGPGQVAASLQQEGIDRARAAAEGGERSPPKKEKRDDKPKSLLEQETAMMRRIARLMESLPAASRGRVAGYVYDHFSPKFVPTAAGGDRARE